MTDETDGNARRGMTILRLVLAELRHEARAACRGPLIPLVFTGLIVYIVLVLLNADYLREMGATGVPRNSPLVAYLMMGGQALWLLFFWAWLFAQAVARDRTANLHEVILSAPVPLPALLAGRYLGAVCIGCLLALPTAVALLLVPLLAALGLIPPDAAGPQPVFAIGHAFLLMTLPSAIGLGALFLCAAILTRGVAGPFALAATLMLAAMVSLVIVRGGDVSPVLATVVDPSGFAEIEEQTVNTWTPREKAAGVLRLTPPLLVNRLLWTFPPLLLLALVLRRVGRERLVLERSPAIRAADRAAIGREMDPADAGAAPLGAPVRPSWLHAAWREAVWHFGVSLRGRGTPLGLFMAVAMGVVGCYIHVVLHADGPFLPRPGLTLSLAAEFFYPVVVFLVAAFVGVIARRDDRTGYGEIVDAAPAPLGSRVAGRALAAAAITMSFALSPAIAVWIVTAFAVPEAFSLIDPLVYFGLGIAPALLELCALVLLSHALIRRAGAAHAVGILCAFVAAINNELGVTTYPPAEVGIPPHITLSEFSAWAPWLGYLLTIDLFKLAVAAGIVALAWLAWRRGTALTVPLRCRAGAERVAGGAGALAAVAVVLAIGSYRVLHEQLVTLGGYESDAAGTADDAAWETHWWTAAAPFTVTGGQVDVAIDPAARRATARWRIDGVRAPSRTLHGSLPHGVEIARATVNGREAAVRAELDHFALPLDACGPEAAAASDEASPPDTLEPSAPRLDGLGDRAGDCTVELQVAARGEGWSAAGESPWLHFSGTWLRATDVLPTLGHDPRPARARAARPPGARAGSRPRPRRGRSAGGGGGRGAGRRLALERDLLRGRRCEPPGGRADRHVRPHRRVSRLRRRVVAECAGRDAPRQPGGAARGGTHARRGRRPRRPDSDGRLYRRDIRACAGGPHGAAGAARARRDRSPRRPALAAGRGGLGHRRRRVGPLAAPRDDRGRAGGAPARGRSRPAEGARSGLATGRHPRLGRPGVRPAGGRDRRLAGAAGAGQRSDRRGARRARRTRHGVATAGAAPWVRHYAPLATGGWVETTGPDDAARAAGRVIADVRGGAALADAISETIGADTAAGLLGPPASSDVLVAPAERVLGISGRRWRWRDGGWAPVAESIHVTQRFEDDRGDRRRIGPVPTTVEPDAPFTLIDAWPSFERTPADNVWRGGEDE